MKYLYLIIILLLTSSILADGNKYLWLDDENLSTRDHVKSIPPPQGFERVIYKSSTYGDWLRGLPLKNKTSKVYLYNGRLKNNQNVHHRVINIDTGDKDLQQCADAAIRLRAEYLYSKKFIDSIRFKFTSGDDAKLNDWFEGIRPFVKGNKVTWRKNAPADSSYENFQNYLQTVFNYAGSYSLSKELIKISDPNKIELGDIFIQGSFPGHVIIVVDVAINKATGKKAILLAQGFTPAQDIHILKNLQSSSLNPWYIINDKNKLYTPEWTFKWTEIRRFQRRD